MMEQTMPEPDLQQQEVDKQNDKRLKTQGSTRDYICGCGKSYYSYSALYLHIRSKHDSKNPEGTKYPRPDKGNVGRPKKDLQGVEQEDLIDPDQPLDELLIYLQDYYKKSDFPEDITKESIDSLQSFPANFFDPHENPQNVYNQIDHILQNENEEIQKDQVNCNYIFAYFLVTFSKHITERCYKEMCFFAMMLRKTLNIIGKDNIEQDSPEVYDEKKEFCEQRFGNMMPLIGNEFITEYLPRFYKEYETKISDFQILGLSETQINNCEKIFAVFCDWLYKNEFTNHTIQGKFQQNSSDSEDDDYAEDDNAGNNNALNNNMLEDNLSQNLSNFGQLSQTIENGKKKTKKQKEKSQKKQQKINQKILSNSQQIIEKLSLSSQLLQEKQNFDLQSTGLILGSQPVLQQKKKQKKN